LKTLFIPCKDETKVLGSGQFGIVCRGYIHQTSGDLLVAVKTVKKNVDTVNFLALLSEIKILAHLEQHENIASLVVSCTANIKNREQNPVCSLRRK
jgi:serine/threonine protein kinase